MRKLANDELNRLNIEQFKAAEKIAVTVVLENVRSALNVGAVFRTADGFRLEKVWLIGYTATPPNKEMHKTALGATETVTWEQRATTSEVIEELKTNGYRVYAVEQVEQSIMLNDFAPAADEKIALIFGNEVSGVEQQTINACDGTLEIPQFGAKHSLNISVSAGIVLWHLVNRKLSGG
ncbi:MAG: RNA methyltransferase [Bacteroidota bacterium]